MKNLAFCIIVKDDTEAKQLDRLLKNIKKNVDAIYVTGNNGKQDKLKEVCKKHGAKYAYEKWTNFADQRNKSFKRAEDDGYKVIGWADVDDTITNVEKLPKLAQLIADGKCDWISMEYQYEFDENGNCTMTHWKPRLTKAKSGEWVGSVHETYIANQAVVTANDKDVVYIHHQEKDHRVKSGERNLKILLEEFNRDQEKTDPRTLYYIGNTLMGLYKFAEAIPFYMDHIKQCGWPEEKYYSIHYLTKCLTLTMNYDKAINAAFEAIKLNPDHPLAYFDIAENYGLKEEYIKQIHWVLMGLKKEKPDASVYFMNDMEYEYMPFLGLAEAYLETHQFDEALEIAQILDKRYPTNTVVKQLLKDCQEVKRGEDFVKAFITVAGYVRNKDRLKAVKLFDTLPPEADEDARIQQMRKMIVPPKNWEDKSVVFYCHPGHEEWAPPSLSTGIGGSETAVIHMSRQLQKLGYKVTVYCRCGSMAGTYQGVEYKPHFHFNPTDIFDTLIIWRYAGFLNDKINAKRAYVWFHDIVHEAILNENIIKNTDKFIFLSKWHRNNIPGLPEEKVFYSNNGIDPAQFEKLDWSEKRPNSLIYTHSYDRGLICLGRDILPLIEKEIPSVTLDVMYGMGNLEKEMDKIPYLKEVYDGAQEIFKKPNVTHHGRISHQRVADLEKSSLVHAYPSEFGETNCISTQVAQAAGAYVISTTQAGAVPERIRFGELIDDNGIYSSQELQQQYANAVIAFLKNPKQLSEDERMKIVDEFKWESTAKSWAEGLLNGQ